MSQVPRRSSGERLWSQAPRLRLLFGHLAGKALRRRIEVDDLIQETFVRALAQGKRLPAPDEHEAALYRFLVPIARHCVVDCARALRARKRDAAHQRLVRSEWSSSGVRESELPDRGPGPSTRAVAAETKRGLEQAYSELPPEYRRVIGLRQFEGLSAALVAKRMGRSEAAVHSLYRRALSAWESAVGA